MTTDTPSTSSEGVDVRLGCDYQGYEFGGGYLDSVCIDGYLWDADSGDADPAGGWSYTHGGEIPCPICNAQEAIDYWTEDNETFFDNCDCEDNDARHFAHARESAISLVNDIRKNRGIAEPFVPVSSVTHDGAPL